MKSRGEGELGFDPAGCDRLAEEYALFGREHEERPHGVNLWTVGSAPGSVTLASVWW